ncbi:MAG: hypothetical protein HW398_1174, partial [Acidobacteria bacterium]|nr:hypothetical protein [Acidobacteriota bacterium]
RDYTEGEPGIGSVAISGPYEAVGSGDTPSRKRLFVCQPSASEPEEACARKILTTLATRAYRRPATEREVQVLFDFYKSGREGGGFEGGIGVALRRVLMSPQFLFRIEPDPDRVAPGAAYPVSDLDLASRLSFFLWSSLPDDELLGLAQQGKLRDPGVLDQQIRRMIADSRVEALGVADSRVDALGTNFAGQWLYLRNVKAVAPDPEGFPDFDENLREALQRETELFFSSTIRDDRSLLSLLNADYTYLNERLARHYGVPNVYGSHFRRVPLKDENRRGLLGQGSILTVTSYATRTSPTLRGKWVMENILGAPLPPPPADVPSLQDRGSDGKILSVRQLIEHEAGKPIDSSGVLPDGTKFQGVGELRTLLLNHPEQFATTVTEKLLTYALGRGVEYYDQPAIRKVVREASASDYRWSSIIAGIVKSTPFQMRRSQEP